MTRSAPVRLGRGRLRRAARSARCRARGRAAPGRLTSTRGLQPQPHSQSTIRATGASSVQLYTRPTHQPCCAFPHRNVMFVSAPRRSDMFYSDCSDLNTFTIACLVVICLHPACRRSCHCDWLDCDREPLRRPGRSDRRHRRGHDPGAVTRDVCVRLLESLSRHAETSRGSWSQTRQAVATHRSRGLGTHATPVIKAFEAPERRLLAWRP